MVCIFCLVCWFQRCARGIFFFCLTSTGAVHFFARSLHNWNKRGIKRWDWGVVSGMLCLWKETLYPPATLASPSTSCLLHTVLSGDACSKWTHAHTYTHTLTHTDTQLPVTGGEGVSSTTSSVILHRRKSFRFLSCLADRWLHMVTAKWKLRDCVVFLYTLVQWEVTYRPNPSVLLLHPLCDVDQLPHGSYLCLLGHLLACCFCSRPTCTHWSQICPQRTRYAGCQWNGKRGRRWGLEAALKNCVASVTSVSAC